MNQRTATGLCLSILLLCTGVLCAESIKDDELDEKKIYCGDASDFENPAEVDYLSIVKATSEYKTDRAVGRT